MERINLEIRNRDLLICQHQIYLSGQFILQISAQNIQWAQVKLYFFSLFTFYSLFARYCRQFNCEKKNDVALNTINCNRMYPVSKDWLTIIFNKFILRNNMHTFMVYTHYSRFTHHNLICFTGKSNNTFSIPFITKVKIN